MEQMEKKKEDGKNLKKIDNNKPFKNYLPGPEKSEMTEKCAQEYHHARHALYFLHMAVYSVISNKPACCTVEKTSRVKVHLACLKEFLSDETSISRTVKILLNAVEYSCPRDYKSWLLFLYTNWQLIVSFAAHYNEDQKCFPCSYFQKLEQTIEAENKRNEN